MLADTGVLPWVALVLLLVGGTALLAAVVAVGRATRLKRSTDELAAIDPLTGLPSREAARADLRRRQRSGSGSVWLIELDRFGSVNERHGHDTGDQLLTAMADQLVSSTTGDEQAYRWVGPQLLVQSDQPMTADQVHERAETYRSCLNAKVQMGHDRLVVSASVVGASAAELGSDPEQAVAGLHAALTRARTDGWAVTGAFNPDLDHPSRGLQLGELVRGAVEDGTIDIRYRPVVHLADLSVAGLEAVASWTDPDGHVVTGADLTSAVEAAGVGGAFSWMVLRDAAERAAAWRDDHPALDLVVMVGVFPEVVASEREKIERWLDDPSTESEGLCVSLIATSRRNPTATWLGLRSLEERGVQVGLAHFGAGWSSLEYLRQLSVSVLTLDAGLVADISSQRDLAIVTQVVGMAHELGVTVVADGIEDREQGEAVAATGTDLATGAALGFAMDPADIDEVLARGRQHWPQSVVQAP
jgi:diguanylate cyclase (GGDEF)-like protein